MDALSDPAKHFNASGKSPNCGDSAFNSLPRSTSAFVSRPCSGWLRPAFAGLQGTFGQSLEPAQKAIVSERPADALRGAQPGEQIGFGLAGQEVGKIGKTLPNRRQRGDAVVLAAQMR